MDGFASSVPIASNTVDITAGISLTALAFEHLNSLGENDQISPSIKILDQRRRGCLE